MELFAHNYILFAQYFKYWHLKCPNTDFPKNYEKFRQISNWLNGNDIK